MTAQQFTAVAAAAPRGHIFIPVPFDPDIVWSAKPRHHILGTVHSPRRRRLQPEESADASSGEGHHHLEQHVERHYTDYVAEVVVDFGHLGGSCSGWSPDGWVAARTVWSQPRR
jgi:hypothetical protein